MEASHRLESDEEDEPLSEEDYDDSQANERLHFSPFT